MAPHLIKGSFGAISSSLIFTGIQLLFWEVHVLLLSFGFFVLLLLLLGDFVWFWFGVCWWGLFGLVFFLFFEKV